MKYKIHVYVLCWNEIDILPFCVDYWKQYAEKVIVYDNGSDDGSIEFMSEFPWIEVRHYDSDGVDDSIYIEIKNTCWKESCGIADFVVVGDMDECIYSPVLFQELDYMKENNMTICGPVQYSLKGDNYPKYEDGKFLHEIITRAHLQKSNHSSWCNTTGKLMLFNPNEIKEINYTPGCHTANPIGNIRLYDKERIFCIHINKGFGVEYNIQRKRILQNRLSQNNKKRGYAIHYSYSDERIRREYAESVARSVNILDIFKDIEERTD